MRVLVRLLSLSLATRRNAHEPRMAEGFGKRSKPLTKTKPDDSHTTINQTNRPTDDTSTTMPSSALALERGQRELDEMRRAANVDPSTARAKKKQLAYTEEEMRAVDPSEGVMPQVVADRMLARIIPFAAAPVIGSVLVFGGFYYANTQLEMDLPPQMVAYATQALLLLAFAGITYGVMSTSYDEDESGSLLGVDEFKANVAGMRGDIAASQARAAQEVAEEEAEEAGIIMNKDALNRAQRRQAKRDELSLVHPRRTIIHRRASQARRIGLVRPCRTITLQRSVVVSKV